MSEVKQEYTGIDPAPEPVSVPVAKVAERSKKPANSKLDSRWVIVFSAGVIAALLTAKYPMFWSLSLEGVVASKLSAFKFAPWVTPKELAITLVALGMGMVVMSGTYAALTIFPKLLDAAQCVLGGLYHSASYTLVGLGVVLKNIGPIAKACVQIPAGLVCPAYATHLSSKKWKVSFEASARWNVGRDCPPIVFFSYVLSASVFVASLMVTLCFSGSESKPFTPTLLVFPSYTGWFVLNALYIIGRCARERKEKANGTIS